MTDEHTKAYLHGLGCQFVWRQDPTRAAIPKEYARGTPLFEDWTEGWDAGKDTQRYQTQRLNVERRLRMERRRSR
jgi:hypothetical protein